ncbi:hypothetical protein [Lutibaculum baratangense]|uniref:Uncharacterized protein n=1 Tax=Lutibaculum baratangense AMV1 TaxID=631454 RepID=V4RI93_9HYPH|nr:hypothetical protein [Lutibaculum baratangense]ESR25851.1 hypothetical protein N177_1186 [Lutibaculum baratangense AMV1]
MSRPSRPTAPLALLAAVALPPLALGGAFLWYVYAPVRVEEMVRGLAAEVVMIEGMLEGVNVTCRFGRGVELRDARVSYACEITGICDTPVRREAFVGLEQGPHLVGEPLARTIAETCPDAVGTGTDEG